jgi:hypothetical protein
MTIVLQMPPGLEASLRDRAAREGVDASTLVLRTLEQQFGSSANPSTADAQTELLLRLNEGPSEEVWRRYHELSAKRDSETLPSEQHDELIGLSQIIEAADVKRLEYMADLAKLRGVGLRALRAELGITDRHTVGEQNNV